MHGSSSCGSGLQLQGVMCGFDSWAGELTVGVVGPVANSIIGRHRYLLLGISPSPLGLTLMRTHPHGNEP
jgi:hypothetical protein